MTETTRTRENAPADVQKRGGTALSLWLSGGGETDCRMVAFLSVQAEVYRDALEKIAELSRTDGAAAPLLVQAGDIAEEALTS